MSEVASPMAYGVAQLCLSIKIAVEVRLRAVVGEEKDAYVSISFDRGTDEFQISLPRGYLGEYSDNYQAIALFSPYLLDDDGQDQTTALFGANVWLWSYGASGWGRDRSLGALSAAVPRIVGKPESWDLNKAMDDSSTKIVIQHLSEYFIKKYQELKT